MPRNDLGTSAEAKQWTRQAAECYYIGGVCDNCSVPDWMKPKCQMKSCVLELIRKQVEMPNYLIKEQKFFLGDEYTKEFFNKHPELIQEEVKLKPKYNKRERVEQIIKDFNKERFDKQEIEERVYSEIRVSYAYLAEILRNNNYYWDRYLFMWVKGRRSQ